MTPMIASRYPKYPKNLMFAFAKSVNEARVREVAKVETGEPAYFKIPTRIK